MREWPSALHCCYRGYERARPSLRRELSPVGHLHVRWSLCTWFHLHSSSWREWQWKAETFWRFLTDPCSRKAQTRVYKWVVSVSKAPLEQTNKHTHGIRDLEKGLHNKNLVFLGGKVTSPLLSRKLADRTMTFFFQCQEFWCARGQFYNSLSISNHFCPRRKRKVI